MKQDIVLVGGGGHCKSVIDVIEYTKKYTIIGIIDDNKVGENILGYPILWNDDDIEKLVQKCRNFIITVGQIKSPYVRISLYEKVLNNGGFLPSVISPHAYVSPHAKIGSGTVIHHGSIINANATIGNNVIMNTGCIVEHDVEIGNHCHISTKSTINGGVKIEDQVFVGSNSVVNQSIIIGKNTIIGSGSVVVSNISAGSLYYGNPAKRNN